MHTVLETERLTLNHLTPGDTSFIIELVNSAGWLKYIGDRNIHTEEEALYYLTNGPIKSYETNGFGLYRVDLKDGNIPIGLCGILKRDTLDHPDLGFAFLPGFEGKGYAFESASATVAFAVDHLKLSEILAITLPENFRSVRLLERLEFQRVSEVEGLVRFRYGGSGVQ